MEDSNYLTLIQKVDELINNHKMNEALILLSDLDPKKTSSKYRFQFASLAVRLAQPEIAIKFLWSRIFEDSRPSEMERFEYASALRKSGLINQSLSQLKRLPLLPQSVLQQAFCHISRWNYGEAVAALHQYLKMIEADSKEAMIAKVNLAASYVFLEKFDEAEREIREIRNFCENRHPQLFLNCLEIQGQIHLHSGKFDLAEKEFALAISESGYQKSTTSLFITKWSLISEIKSGKMSAEDIKVRNFLNEVRTQGHWETLRDWDFQIAQIASNHQQFVHNYFGSPFEEFRERSRKHLGSFSLPNDYLWFDPRSKEKIEYIIEMYNPRQLMIPIGKNTHRLFMLLCSDFYKPWSVERIFDVLFTNEIFDPFSSHKRVYKQLEELKTALGDFPIEFRSTTQGYRLRPDPGACFVIKENLQFPDSEQFFKALIQTHFHGALFTRDDLSKIIPLNAHQWQRQLKKLSEVNLIESLGQGKSTKYRLKVA